MQALERLLGPIRWIFQALDALDLLLLGLVLLLLVAVPYVEVRLIWAMGYRTIAVASLAILFAANGFLLYSWRSRVITAGAGVIWVLLLGILLGFGLHLVRANLS